MSIRTCLMSCINQESGINYVKLGEDGRESCQHKSDVDDDHDQKDGRFHDVIQLEERCQADHGQNECEDVILWKQTLRRHRVAQLEVLTIGQDLRWLMVVWIHGTVERTFAW